MSNQNNQVRKLRAWLADMNRTKSRIPIKRTLLKGKSIST